jgi:cobyrinic acid a,c-diamide synthase
MKVQSFKCGPDYIDPMFHRKVLKIPSGNLDTFFTDESVMQYLLCKKAQDADITVLEGVMGYYDGLGGESDRASTYEIARVTDTPVILVVDAKGASVTLAALIRGIKEFRQDSHIQGVLLNRVSAAYYERLRVVIERECGIPVLGFVPFSEKLALPSRHLGLLSPEEIEGFSQWIACVADTMEQCVDVEKVLEIAQTAGACSGKEPQLKKLRQPVRIAIARDEAFSFYYEENMELLRQMGALIVEFSPLHEKDLPKETDGLILGGGYPELYAQMLAENTSMKQAIRAACESGMPCLAECGGFLYLQKRLEGQDGKMYDMAGVLSGEGYRTAKLCRFGYMQARSQKDGLLGKAGSCMKGHEFHYWDCTENGTDFLAQKPLSEKSYPVMVQTETLAAGFLHFYYYSNPEMIFHFLETCEKFRNKKRII